ncbi:MAG: serine/threonine protein kinase [Myxococcales bacterium]|nr:serine/threonine protein kinase [Myxococcales bacterium]
MSVDEIELATTQVVDGAKAAASDERELGRGDEVGRYIILDRLGAGGMGVVYVAFDPELDRRVAIKLLRWRGGRAEDRTRLLREAQAMARLQHPNVVAVHDVGVLGGRVWTAMELVEGVTLGAWLGAAPRSWSAVLEVMLAVAGGLAAAHAAGLVHRDIKPDNVMIGVDGRVRVVDFGLARAGEALPRTRAEEGLADIKLEGSSRISGISRTAFAAEVTHQGAIVGTPAYMAPEHFIGDVADARSDQFGWCVTCWEAIFGERPFAGETLGELVMAVSSGRMRAPPRGRAPAWLRRALERGLRADPGERFPSMDALAQALGRGRSGARRWRIAAAALAALALALSVALALELRRAEARDACVREADASADALWSADLQAAVERAFSATALPYAAVASRQSAERLSAYREAWSDAAATLCVDADVDGRVDPGDAAVIRRCLDERRQGLVALVGLLAEADAEIVERAVEASASLPPIDACRDPLEIARRRQDEAAAGATGRDVPALDALRERLARARSLANAGKAKAAAAEFASLMPSIAAAGDPHLHARALVGQASALLEIDRRDEADAAAIDALQRSLAAGDDETAARVYALLTALRKDRGDLEEALRWARAGEAQLQRIGAEEGPEASHLALIVGDLEIARGDLDAAEAAIERAIAIDRRLFGEGHPQVGRSLNALGIVQEERGDYEAALRLYREASATLSATLSDAHPSVAKVEENLGNIQWARGDLDAAIAHHQRALAIRLGAYGPEHANVGLSHLNLGNIFFQRGDFDRAEDAYRRALAIFERALGPDNLRVAYALVNLSSVLLIRERHEEARALLDRALEIRVAALGREHSDVAFVLSNLGDVAATSGDDGAATALYEEALAIWEKTLGAEHPYLVNALVGLGALATRRGDAERARGLLARALAIVSKESPSDSIHLLEPLIALADAERLAGDHAAALRDLERAQRIASAPEASPRQRAAALFLSARTLVESGGERPRAEALAGEAMAIFREAGAAAEAAEVEAWLGRRR